MSVYDDFGIISDEDFSTFDDHIKVIKGSGFLATNYSTQNLLGIGLMPDSTNKYYAYDDIVALSTSFNLALKNVWPYHKKFNVVELNETNRIILTLSYLGVKDGSNNSSSALHSGISGLCICDNVECVSIGISANGEIGIYGNSISTGVMFRTFLDISTLKPQTLTLIIDIKRFFDVPTGRDLVDVNLRFGFHTRNLHAVFTTRAGSNFTANSFCNIVAISNLAPLKSLAFCLHQTASNEFPSLVQPDMNVIGFDFYTTQRSFLAYLTFNESTTQAIGNSLIAKYELKFWLFRSFKIDLKLENGGSIYKPKKIIVDNRKNAFTIIINYNLLEIVVAPNDRYELAVNSEFDNIILNSSGMVNAFAYVVGDVITDQYKTF